MNNQEYWKSRSILKEKRLKNLTDKFLKELEIGYKRSLKELEQDLEKWYSKYAKEDGITLGMAKSALGPSDRQEYQISMMDILNVAGANDLSSDHKKKYFRERITRLESLRLQMEARISMIGKSESLDIYEHLKDTYKESYYESSYNLYNDLVPEDIRTAGTTVNELPVFIMNSFSKLNDAAVETAVMSPWSGKSFSERIWKNNKKLIREVRDVLTIGVTQGHSIDKMSHKLSKRMDVGYNRAVTLIRTEANFVMEEASFKMYDSAGLEKYKYLATLDSKTSLVCRNLDGKIFLVKDKKVGVNCNPMHPRCRSTTIPYFLEYEEDEGTRIARNEKGNNYKVSSNVNYKQWFDNLSSQYKEQIEVERMMQRNKSNDKIQYDKYKERSISGFPKSFEAFQRIKYNDINNWDRIKAEYSKKENLQKQLPYKINGEKMFIPKDSLIRSKKVIAGGNSGKSLRVEELLISKYGGKNGDWIKCVGKIKSKKYEFDVHWYEYQGIQYEMKLKHRKEGKK